MRYLISRLFLLIPLISLMSVSLLFASEEWRTEDFYKNPSVNLAGKISNKQQEDYKFIATQIKANAITEIDLSDNSIEVENFEILVASLSSHHSLKKIRLQNTLDSMKALILLNYLTKDASTIADLDLSHNQIYGWGIININTLLMQTKTLENLDLSSNPIEGKIAPQIKEGLLENNSLKTLKLASIKLDGTALSDITEGLCPNKTLTDLDVSSNPLQDEGAVSIRALLSDNDTLENLNLSNTEMTDFGLIKIALGLQVNKGLEELNIDLSHNSFTDAGRKTFEEVLSKIADIKIVTDEQSSFKIIKARTTSNPYLARIASLRKALEAGQLSAVSELVEFYKEAGPQLKAYLSEDAIQELHDKAGGILHSNPSSVGNKLEEYKVKLPSNEEFQKALQQVLE